MHGHDEVRARVYRKQLLLACCRLAFLRQALFGDRHPSLSGALYACLCVLLHLMRPFVCFGYSLATTSIACNMQSSRYSQLISTQNQLTVDLVVRLRALQLSSLTACTALSCSYIARLYPQMRLCIAALLCVGLDLSLMLYRSAHRPSFERAPVTKQQYNRQQ